MRFKEIAKEKATGTDGEQPEVPEDFICIDPPQKPLVFDFLTNFDQDIKELAMLHLRLCLHCREIAATVLEINRYLENGRRCLHAETSEVEADTEKVS